MTYRILLIISLVASCESKDPAEIETDSEPVFEIQKIADLDPQLTESSGALFLNGKLYSHSDMGGVANLLQLNLDGTINETISYQNARVKDWEDIASDDNFIYIADIGNNLANRKDLQIFKIAKSQMNNPKAAIETISFSFNDQTDFGNGEYNKNSYDAEAIAVIEGQMYVFTKDWVKLDTKIYRFSTQAGNYPSDPLTTLNIGGLVTGATTTPDGTIVICGYSPTLSPFVAQLKIIDGLPTMHRKVDITGMLGTGSQIEGITYAGKVDGAFTYYLTSEKFTRIIAGQNIEFPANLYELKWNE
ncbi:hypothetical protein [Nonlabens antarcticus]|uniref:hypothetical protein n=1 Tax=Nonlabens antarcticus TaxID=392714 RepID=UPI00189148EC|nr:hypothetical protein [Nonlabens antarcticus]